MKKIQQFLQKPWLYLLIIAIGISLKFYHLDYRYFWFDEICTIQHTSGIPLYQYSDLIPENEIISIRQYKDLLDLKKQNYSLGSELKGLYTSTNLNPLHYTFLMIWYRIVGDKPVHYRLFSVLCFLITLPFLFFLTRTLFRSDLAAWISVSLYSVSPFIHMYAQEARYCMFWLFFIVVIHYLFLRFINEKKYFLWILYALTGILALYASVLSGLILFGHLVYICIFRKKLRIKYSITLLIVLAAFSPWIISIIENREEIMFALSWSNREEERSILPIIINSELYYYRFFINVKGWPIWSLLYDKLSPNQHFSLFFAISILIIIYSSIIYFFRKARKETLYFILIILLPTLTFFWISDLIRNAWSGGVIRYKLNAFIVILLIISFLMHRKIASGKIVYYILYLGLVVIGSYSIINASGNRCFEVYSNCDSYLNESTLFSEAQKPLLITDYSMNLGLGFGEFLTLTNEYESESIYILRASPNIENVEKILTGSEYSEIYIVHASDELIKNLKSQFGTRMDSLDIEGINSLWQINLNKNID